MATNYFIGKSQAWLEAELARVQEDLARGKVTVQAASGDILIRSQTESSLKQRWRDITIALNKLDPVTYPPEDITPLAATKAVFS